MRKKITHPHRLKAFTLSEVLITLVIIGVIAAITVPNIIQSTNKQETLSRLEKAYSAISNGLRMSQQENGPFSDWPIGENMTDIDQYFNQYWRPYFANIQKYNNAKELGYDKTKCWKNINGEQIRWDVASRDSRILFSFLDGTVVFYPRNTSDEEGNPIYTNYFYVDTNGSKKPNVIGKDVFIFYVVDNDNIKPYCYGQTKEYINQYCSKNINWKNNNCCTAKVMNDGWQFKSDHPW